MATLAAAKRYVNKASIARVRRSIRASMMHHVVHVLADEFNWLLVAEQSQTGRVTKRTITHHIYPIDRLSCGVQ